MSANWCLVSTYLIWILGSRLVLSNIQSRETLWVVDSCLIVGLLPLMIIYITTSYFKDEQHRTKARKLRVRRNTVNMVQIKITVLGWKYLGFVSGVLVWCGIMRQVSSYLTLGVVQLVWGRMEHFKKNKSQRSRAGIPSMRKLVSRAIISASVEHCETEVCFLHIQLPDTNVWLPKMHKSLPDVDFESSRSPAKSESWNNPILHCCAVLPTWQYCLRSNVPRICHKLWSIQW